MNFLKYELGYRKGGEIVEVTLSGQANVRLMDSSNFSSFRSGRHHRFIGGGATRSPVRLQIPRAGNWIVVVDLGGRRGTVRASARVLPGMLRSIRELPLSDIAALVQNETDEDDVKTYDVFISHASEDKQEVVAPLAKALRDGGLTVWYDEFELKIGDSLRKKIDKGVANSRFGIVVLSKSFFSKGWTNYELDGLVTRSNSGEQVILPIWHNVSKQDVMTFSASLADKVARSTGASSVADIAREIIDVVSVSEFEA